MEDTKFKVPDKSGVPPNAFVKTRLTKIRADSKVVTVTYDKKSYKIKLSSKYGIEFDFKKKTVLCYLRS